MHRMSNILLRKRVILERGAGNLEIWPRSCLSRKCNRMSNIPLRKRVVLEGGWKPGNLPQEPQSRKCTA